MTFKNNQKGFSAIEVLLIVLVLVAIGGVGYTVYHKNHNPKSDKSSHIEHYIKTNKTAAPINTDIYAGWKQYCNTNNNYCFKYPTDWTLLPNPGQITILNASKTVEVDYINPYVHDSGLLSFDPVSISKLSVSGMSLDIVGGVYLPADEPDYGVIDSSLLNTYPLTVGTTTNFPNALRFTDTHSSSFTSVAFRSRATSQMSSQAAAEEWYSSPDATTSLKILKSLYYQ